jgi:hypothetical protein
VTMTREEYEEKRRRLEVDAADAKAAYNRARALYDGICDELRNLRIDWNEQQKAADRTTAK